jgi:putative flippase GtrA
MGRAFAWRPTRYVVVGAICAAVQNAVLILGDRAGIHYLVTSFASIAVVTPLGYWLHSDFTFAEKLSLRAFLRFAAGIVAAIPVFLLTMATLCSVLGLPMIIAAPIGTVVLFAWNYLAAHWAILGRLLPR